MRWNPFRKDPELAPTCQGSGDIHIKLVNGEKITLQQIGPASRYEYNAVYQGEIWVSNDNIIWWHDADHDLGVIAPRLGQKVMHFVEDSKVGTND